MRDFFYDDFVTKYQRYVFGNVAFFVMFTLSSHTALWSTLVMCDWFFITVFTAFSKLGVNKASIDVHYQSRIYNRINSYCIIYVTYY